MRVGQTLQQLGGKAMSSEPIITIAEAARQPGVPVGTLRRLVSLERVPSVSVTGIRRLRLSQVQACLVEHRKPELATS
jgi:hypothetical protein